MGLCAPQFLKSTYLKTRKFFKVAAGTLTKKKRKKGVEERLRELRKDCMHLLARAEDKKVMDVDPPVPPR